MTNRISRVLYVSAGLLWPHSYIDDFLIRAFKYLGIDVSVYYLKPEGFLREAFSMEGNFEEEFLRGYMINSRSARELTKEVTDLKPDLIFTVQGYMIPKEVLIQLREAGVPIVSWFMDEPYDSSRSIHFGRYFTHIFVQDSSAVQHHEDGGNKNVHFLPHGVDHLQTHCKSKGDGSFYSSDICLIGTGFPKRKAYIKKLIDRGYRIKVVGPYWEDMDGIELIGSYVNPGEAARYYRNAKINVNIHREEHDFAAAYHTVKAQTLNCSSFYIAGCGGFQIVDNSRDVAAYYTPGSDVAVAADEEDFAAKIEYFMNNAEKRETLKNNAYERTLTCHKYTDRIQTMIDIVERPLSTTVFPQTVAVVPFPIDHIIKSGNYAYSLNSAIFEADSEFIAITSNKGQAVSQDDLDAMQHDASIGATLTHDNGNHNALLISKKAIQVAGILKKGYISLTYTLLDYLWELIAAGYRVEGVLHSLKKSLIALCAETQERLDHDTDKFDDKWSSSPHLRIFAEQESLRAQEYLDSEDYNNALVVYTNIAEQCPDYYQAYKGIGICSMHMGKFDDAVHHYQEYLSNDKEPSLRVRLYYVLALQKLSRYDDALRELEFIKKTYDLNPGESNIVEGYCHNVNGLMNEERRNNNSRESYKLDGDVSHVQ